MYFGTATENEAYMIRPSLYSDHEEDIVYTVEKKLEADEAVFHFALKCWLIVCDYYLNMPNKKKELSNNHIWGLIKLERFVIILLVKRGFSSVERACSSHFRQRSCLRGGRAAQESNAFCLYRLACGRSTHKKVDVNKFSQHRLKYMEEKESNGLMD